MDLSIPLASAPSSSPSSLSTLARVGACAVGLRRSVPLLSFLLNDALSLCRVSRVFCRTSFRSLSTSSGSSSTENSAPRCGLLEDGARLTGPGRRGVCGVTLCGRVLDVLGIEPVTGVRRQLVCTISESRTETHHSRRVEAWVSSHSRWTGLSSLAADRPCCQRNWSRSAWCRGWTRRCGRWRRWGWCYCRPWLPAFEESV